MNKYIAAVQLSLIFFWLTGSSRSNPDAWGKKSPALTVASTARLFRTLPRKPVTVRSVLRVLCYQLARADADGAAGEGRPDRV